MRMNRTMLTMHSNDFFKRRLHHITPWLGLHRSLGTIHEYVHIVGIPNCWQGKRERERLSVRSIE